MYNRLRVANEVANMIDEIYASEGIVSSFKSAMKYQKFLQKYGFDLREDNFQSVLDNFHVYPKQIRLARLHEILDAVSSIRKEYPNITLDANAKSMDRLIAMLEQELADADANKGMYKLLDKLDTGMLADAYLADTTSCLDKLDPTDPENTAKLNRLVTNVPKWVKADQKKLIIAAKQELTRLGKRWRWDAASQAIPDPSKMKIIVDEYGVSVDGNEILVYLYFFVTPKNVSKDDHDFSENVYPRFSVHYSSKGWIGDCEWDSYDNEWFDCNYSK